MYQSQNPGDNEAEVSKFREEIISILEFCLQAGNLLSVQMEQRLVRTSKIPEIYLQEKPCRKVLQAVVSKTGEGTTEEELGFRKQGQDRVFLQEERTDRCPDTFGYGKGRFTLIG